MSTLDHLAAIQCELAAAEIAAMGRYFIGLAPVDRDKWIATLQTLSVDDAVAIIRSELELAAERERADAVPGTTSTPAVAVLSTGEPDPHTHLIALAHLVAIQGALPPGERDEASAMLTALPPAERSTLFAKLLALSVADGVAVLRDELGKRAGPSAPEQQRSSGIADL
jgi:hypothetical protein